MIENRSILVVEDSPEDWLIMQRAMNKSNLKNEIIRMADGDEALDYLSTVAEPTPTRPKPRVRASSCWT